MHHRHYDGDRDVGKLTVNGGVPTCACV
uniref:Uncharacterized protein n=1 Tax=Anopheles dirus TaxID=7168 RepID=A0A182NX55_9DIPT